LVNEFADSVETLAWLLGAFDRWLAKARLLITEDA
jgi:hypothetical protein